MYNMKWFKKLVANWAQQGRDYAEVESMKSTRGLVRGNDVEAVCGDDPVLNFKVYSAVGGKVVEFRRYDRKSDRNDSTTYIITNDQDFGDRIAKIATMEQIKL
jgi:hypothetical protein